MSTPCNTELNAELPDSIYYPFKRLPGVRLAAYAFACVEAALEHAEEEILKNRNGANTGTFDLRRLRDILPRLGRVLLRPSELKEDLQLDRWPHHLYNAD